MKQKFIPYAKLSKKKKREHDALQRGAFGTLQPVTRRIESAKRYNRKKARRWKNDFPQLPGLSVSPLSLLLFPTLWLQYSTCPNCQTFR